ncbi:MAG: hypothetical protein ACRYFW_06335 [Janthinobacterium lividum]
MVRRSLAAALLLASSAAAPAAWQKASSRYFIVYSDDTPDHVRAYTERLEKFDKAIRVWHQAPEDVRGDSARVTVFVVGNIGAIQKLAGYGGVAGFYDPHAGGSVAFVPRSSGEGGDYGMRPQAILFHEYTHHWMLTNWTDAAMPPWYVEGAAELHATAEFRGGGVTFGAPPLYRGYTVDNYNLLPADMLVRPNPGKLDGERRDALYSRGWLLTHYLTFDPGRRKQLADYLAAINAGKSGDAAAEAFGGTGGLDLRLNGYLRSIATHHPYFTAAADQLAIGPIALRPLTAAEAAVMPAYMASKRGVSAATAPQVATLAEGAAAHFASDAFVQDEVAEAEYDACSTDKKADASCFARSEAAAERALALDPRSIHALVYKGMAQEAAARRAKVTDPVRWTAIRRVYLAANKVDPNAPEPLLRYYTSFADSGAEPTANAEGGMLYAYQLAPYDPDVRLNATRVLLHQKDAARARVAVAPVAYNLDDAGHAAFGQKVLAALDKDGSAAALAEFGKADAEARKKEADPGKPKAG